MSTAVQSCHGAGSEWREGFIGEFSEVLTDYRDPYGYTIQYGHASWLVYAYGRDRATLEQIVATLIASNK